MCSDCDQQERYGYSRQYSPACLQCGRRYLKAIQRLDLLNAVKVQMLRKALADWKAMGHSEAQLRESPQSQSVRR